MPTETEYRVALRDFIDAAAEMELAVLTDAVMNDDVSNAVDALASCRIEGEALLGRE